MSAKELDRLEVIRRVVELQLSQVKAGKMLRVHEWEDGRVELRCEGRLLPYSIFDKNPIVTQGAIVENKRLGAVLAAIQASQTLRDQARLTSRKLTLREKDRLRAARVRAGTPDAEARPTTPNRTSLLGFDTRASSSRRLCSSRPRAPVSPSSLNLLHARAGSS